VPGGGGGTASDLAPLAEGRCDDIGLQPIEPFSSTNMSRLRDAYETIVPEASRAKSDAEEHSVLLQLAVYQFEVMSEKPDPALAGTFLGSVAQVAMTSDLVDQVNWKLCVDPRTVQSSLIAKSAEAERNKRLEPSTSKRSL
jgi:hypothetical protein